MMDSEKVLQRTSSLLQNKSFTDVTFIVGPPNSSKKYVGHRVLLAMTSPVFEAMFYGDMADKSKVIRITDIAPIGFENLLRYAYTDTLNLQTVEDAMLTAYAAKKYILPHLLRECFNFLEKSVTPKTVCQVYEFSVVLEAHFLIYQCLNVIDRQTYHVLTSTSFNNVSVSTLEMIVRRPYLNLYSEFSLYNALYMWAEEECAKRNVEADIENLRRSLETTLPHIRFLTMTPEEFSKGPAKSGLLTKDECFHVFMNLAVPGIVPIPRGLSSETVKRSVPPEYFSCRRYKASAYHSPVRPLRIVGLRFIVVNHDIFLTGLGFPARLDSGFYSVRQPKYDGVIRYTYQIQDGKMEHEDADVNFILSKDKDVKITLKKPFYVRKGVEGELELQLGKFLAEDVVIPSLKNRKKDDTVNGVTFQFSSFQRGQLGNMTDIMEFSEIFFYY